MLKRKKRHFVLLELLVALTLFILCVAPFIEIPARTLAVQLKTYQRLGLYRLVDLGLVDAKAQLYQNAIPWKDLCQKRKNKYPITKEPIRIQGKWMGNRGIQRTVSVYTTSCKPGDLGQQYNLLDVEICLTCLSEKRFFYFQRKWRKNFFFHHKMIVSREPERIKIPLSEILPKTEEKKS